MNAGHAWHWLLLSAKPIPIATPCTRERLQIIVSRMGSMHLQWSAGQTYATQRLVCARRPGHQGGLKAGGSDTRSNNRSCCGHDCQSRAHSTKASHRHRDLPDKSFQVRFVMPSHLCRVPPTGSRMSARVLTSCCDPIVAGSTESTASVIRTTMPSVTRT